MGLAITAIYAFLFLQNITFVKFLSASDKERAKVGVWCKSFNAYNVARLLKSANVRTTLRHVANPSVWRVSWNIFSNAKVPNLQIAQIVHGYFKVHVDWTEFSTDLRCAGFIQIDFHLHGLFRCTW
mmetsp:Transcript_2865/g.3819  ORF Transcript_2865/g.3819 Transcript_2865/m.3819 type:complete len:126 (+) Transcript_2865:33-410(+)